MPKKETLEIQNFIKNLGTKMGFETALEERIHENDIYAPIYDAVWYLDLTKYFNFDSISYLFEYDLKWLNRCKRIPFAGFEIEGDGTTSKYELSNFSNLYSGDFLYSFVIVNNKGAINEEDIYRRGFKIAKYFNFYAGNRNVFFMDKIHLENSAAKITDWNNDITMEIKDNSKRNKFGGETVSAEIYKSIKKDLAESGFQIEQNYSTRISDIMFCIIQNVSVIDENSKFALNMAYYKDPYSEKVSLVKNKREAFYVPKLDVVLGFNAPKVFTDWLRLLANELKKQVSAYPLLYGIKYRIIEDLFVPLIAIEMESKLGKHLNGGIFNMSKNAYVGILITRKNASVHIDFYKREFGLKNILSYCTEG